MQSGYSTCYICGKALAVLSSNPWIACSVRCFKEIQKRLSSSTEGS